MPIEYRIDPVLRLVEAKVTGHLSLNDLREYVQQISTDSAFGADLVMLADFSGMEPTISSNEYVRYGEWRRRILPFRKLAIVAPTDLEFGMARMYASTVGTKGAKDLRLFRDRKSAYEWLGIPDPQLTGTANP